MKNSCRFLVILTVVSGFFATIPLTRGASHVWTGTGASNVWSLVDNWVGGIPQSGNDVVFTNTVGLLNTNDLTGRSFSSINFATPSGAFSLLGNSVTITG